MNFPEITRILIVPLRGVFTDTVCTVVKIGTLPPEELPCLFCNPRAEPRNEHLPDNSPTDCENCGGDGWLNRYHEPA